MTQPSAAGVPEVDVDEAARRATSDAAVLIDVREPDEWALGRAPQAMHLPLSSLQPAQVPTGRAVLALCRTGNRSAKAAAQLAAAGIEVTNVAGGMQAWEAAGLPVVADGGVPGRVK